MYMLKVLLNLAAPNKSYQWQLIGYYIADNSQLSFLAVLKTIVIVLFYLIKWQHVIKHHLFPIRARAGILFFFIYSQPIDFFVKSPALNSRT